MAPCTSQTKQQIAAFLPEALRTAVRSYETYYAVMHAGGTDKFAEYHKNAKVAVAHIELLIKLAKWAEVDVKDIQQGWHVYGSEALVETNAYYDNDVSET